MRRKKSRHKAVAIEFLSGISLDGCYSNRAVSRNPLTGHLENSDVIPAAGFKLARSSSNEASKLLNSYSSIVECSDFSTETSHSTKQNCPQCSVSDDLVTLPQFVKTHQEEWNTGSNNRCTEGNYLPLASGVCQIPLNSQSSIGNGYTQPGLSGGSSDGTAYAVPTTVDRTTIRGENESPEVSTRVTLCPAGLPTTKLVVFSVIPFGRKTCHLNIKTTGRVQTLNAPPPSVTGLLSGQHHHEPQQQQQSQQLQSQIQQQARRLSQSQPHTQQSTSNSVVSNEPLLTAFVADPSRSLSSMRPIGDEVVSFAQFLKPQSNLWLSSPYACTLLQPNCLAYGFRDSEFAVSNPSDPLKAAFGPTSNRSRKHHLSNANLTGMSPWSRSTYAFPRARNSSGGSSCLVPSVPGNSSSGIVYPDPLVYYVPTLLDDPDLLIATGKRVLKLPNYLTSVIAYVRPSEQKRNVNREFHERFPFIQLTLTKLRSIKSTLVRISQRLSLDLWITAHGIVLFEKLILRLLVNKLNRRLCASAVLLISAKLNDVKRNELSSLVQELENQFKISRRDLIQTELDVALSLEFCLVPGDQEIMIHYLRIHKSLDLTPSYSLSCLGRLPHSASLPSVAVHEHRTA